MITLNEKDTGYRGIWYMNQPSNDEYVYKYSGGLGTYCAKHQPFAVYSPEANKTFFCYGGTSNDSFQNLRSMVSYFDHSTGLVPRPILLLDKSTDDAHDNPVISLDEQGHIWIFSTAHGRGRPAYIHRSSEPFSIDELELIDATRQEDGASVPFDNFSYMQMWQHPEGGFSAFLTHYKDPADRTSFFISSEDGVSWNEWRRLAAIEQGHYQISALGAERVGSAFNFHPTETGLNWRTNLYYMETPDRGRSWCAADGTPIEIPLTEIDNPALIRDYQSEGLKVYLKDIRYDEQDRPVVLFLTSKGYESGPKNAPRTWTTAHYEDGNWRIKPAMTSDNNYDMGSLYIEDDCWRIIAPTGVGPQPFNPGGEVEMWTSKNRGETWSQDAHLTEKSCHNHTYVRRPVNAHPDFYAMWADGHARQPSASRIYFCSRAGDVRVLPNEMEADFAEPEALSTTTDTHP